MKTIRWKASSLAVGALLLCGGVLAGAGASSMTSDGLVWRAPSQVPIVEGPVTAAVDQAGAGQAWARSAFDGGLRRCPEMNSEFFSACQAEMQKLIARPAFSAGTYGGPLLITKIEPVRPDRAWDAQDRLEQPRPALQEADYEPLPDPTPEPAYEPTPDNYPAAAAEPNGP